jgi:hypothetical protein
MNTLKDKGEKKRYCYSCGFQLIERQIPHGYNTFTGNQDFLKIWECPNGNHQTMPDLANLYH